MTTNYTDIAKCTPVPGVLDNGAPACAAGGASEPSRLVIRDETTNTPVIPDSTAFIDWLSFTVYPSEGRNWMWLRGCLQFIFEIQPQAWRGTNKRWSGYTHRVDLVHTGQRGETISLGLVAYGGESQRGTMHVSLNAQACALVKDWQQVMEWGDSVGATITRVDCAHDDLEGKILTIEQVRRWYTEGLFSVTGRPPNAHLHDDLDSGKGKTFYIGNRAHGKLARFYEKGKQLGDPKSLWMRAEVEYRNTSREVLWDILINPGHYLAGAYPCLAYLSEIQSRIKTIKKAGSISYEKMSAWVSTAAGKAINVMIMVEGDESAVIKLIRREGTPKRLQPYVGIDGALVGRSHGNVEP